jgi:glucose-6-phosphate isomerase
MSAQSLWERYQAHLVRYNDLGIWLDISRMRFDDAFFETLTQKAEEAFSRMKELEAGAIANPDENRMVGHYWLRYPSLAPTAELRDEIDTTRESILKFAADIHKGAIKAGSVKFTDVLLIGIGGSALGPQFISQALGTTKDAMKMHFLDNTDPDGFDKIFAGIPHFATTLTVVISKSGGTKETRNGMLEAQARYEAEGLSFGKHAVAVTGHGSELDKFAERGAWLRRFPMWDWVGGRTSVMSAVGLLPMALQGLDIGQFLAGAAAMDAKTRVGRTAENAAMLIALMWYYAGNGKGEKDMVILPYKDRLVLFSKYLQQLVMESLGKEKDLAGNVVHQGIAVYGNKGSTDQHAYVQQLREGVPNFFATFIEVRKDRDSSPFDVEPGVTSGDYLQGFLRGTRSALYENGRDSITLSIPHFDAFTVGALIALYERAVGFYGSLVNVNAYHQPGVEAGKKAAARILALQGKVKAALQAAKGAPKTPQQIALETDSDPEDVFHVLNHLSANASNVLHAEASQPGQETFWQS